MSDRLDAFLSQNGFGTRSAVRQMIHYGGVKVDGKTIREHGHLIRGRRVTVRGVEVVEKITSATLLFNKPLGYACSHDPAEEPLVDALIPEAYRHLAMNTAGRLDRDTSGLLIVTTEGPLIHQLTNPKKHLTKRYRVAYSGTLSAHAVERVSKGIELEGDPRPTLPARLELAEKAADGLGQATMYLSEGRYHQVRKMFEALGAQVERLHRDQIGGLDLPEDLALGSMRPITDEELARLHGRDATGARVQGLAPQSAP